MSPFLPTPASAAPSTTPCTGPTDPRRRRALALAGVVLLGPAAAWAQDGGAVEFEGQRFARRVTLAGTELSLNGTGLRAVAWFKGFVAALYLQRRASSPAQALALPGPKRIQMRLLHEVPAKELSKAVNKGMLRNVAPEARDRLQPRLAGFVELIDSTGTVREGDVVDLDLEPERGTVLRVNGNVRGQPVPGTDFYAALLASFIGDRPYDPRLKAGLLGGA